MSLTHTHTHVQNIHVLLWKLGHIPHVPWSCGSLLGQHAFNKVAPVKWLCRHTHWKRSHCQIVALCKMSIRDFFFSSLTQRTTAGKSSGMLKAQAASFFIHLLRVLIMHEPLGVSGVRWSVESNIFQWLSLLMCERQSYYHWSFNQGSFPLSTHDPFDNISHMFLSSHPNGSNI